MTTEQFIESTRNIILPARAVFKDVDGVYHVTAPNGQVAGSFSSEEEAHNAALAAGRGETRLPWEKIIR